MRKLDIKHRMRLFLFSHNTYYVKLHIDTCALLCPLLLEMTKVGWYE